MSCYEQFGWTPQECREVLRRDPAEATLLGIYFSELGAERGRQQREADRRASHNSSDDGFTTDAVIGDDDELEEED